LIADRLVVQFGSINLDPRRAKHLAAKLIPRAVSNGAVVMSPTPIHEPNRHLLVWVTRSRLKFKKPIYMRNASTLEQPRGSQIG
jgi:hypothetical protein